MELILSTGVVIAVVDASVGIIIQLTALKTENSQIRFNRQASTYYLLHYDVKDINYH